MANPFDAEPTNPFDSAIERNPFDAPAVSGRTEGETALSHVTSIGEAPSLADRLVASAKRKYAIATKSAAKGFTAGYATPEDISYSYPEDYREQFLKTEPNTDVERAISGTAELGYSLLPMKVASKIVGLGAKGLNKVQLGIRTAGLGGVLGAAEKPEGEDTLQKHLTGALKGAAAFGAFGGATLGMQHVLSQYSRAHLYNTLTKARKVVARVETMMKNMETSKVWQILQDDLTPYERNTVMNILKGKNGMEQKQWKGWFEKNIGEPAYEGFINFLDNIVPEPIKERFVYGGARPADWMKLTEQRLLGLSKSQDTASTLGKLVSDGITEAESKIILRSIAEPTQMDILKTMRPDLHGRAIQARNAIDELSQSLSGIKNLPDKTRDTILKNIDHYVKRVYEAPPDKRGLMSLFMGRRGIREPKIFEKGAVARKMAEKPIHAEIDAINRELQHMMDIEQIEGIGPIVKAKLKRAGYGDIGRLIKADPTVIDEIMFGKKVISFNPKTIKVDIYSRKINETKTYIHDRKVTGIPEKDYDNIIRQVKHKVKNPDDIDSIHIVGSRSVGKYSTKPLGEGNILQESDLDILVVPKKGKKITFKGGGAYVFDEEGEVLPDLDFTVPSSPGIFRTSDGQNMSYDMFTGRVGKFVKGMKKKQTGNLEILKNLQKTEVTSVSAGGETHEASASAFDILAQGEAIDRYRQGLVNRRNYLNGQIKNPLIKPDIPYEVRKKMGQIETAGYPVGRSISDMGYKIETARLFEGAAENSMLATADEAMARANDWVKLKEDTMLGSLSGMWVQPGVAKDINAITRIMSESEKAYTRLLSMWKVGKTTINPATHGRNIVSNTLLLEMSGVPIYRIPDLLSGAIDDMAKNTNLYKIMKKYGLGYGTFKSAEIEALRDVYSKKGISGMLESAGHAADKSFLGDMARLYQAEEEIFKIAKARHLIEQGFKVENALAEADKWLFNYSKVPEFIRKLRTHPLGSPFLTFQYKAIPRVLEAIFKRPLDIIKYPLMMWGIEEYSQKKFGLTNEDMALLKKDKPLTFVLPFPDNEGNIRLFDLQYIVPYGELFERRKFAGHEMPTFGFMQNPVYSIPINIGMFNKDPYTGKEIVSEHATEFKKTAQIMKYIGTQLMPPLTPILGAPAEVIRKAVEGRSDRYGVKTAYWWDIAGALTGMKTRPASIAIEKFKLLQRSAAMWKDYDMRQASLVKDGSLTPEEKSRGIKELWEERMRGFNKIWEGKIHKEVNPFDNPFD